MKEDLLADEPCDVFVTADGMVSDLAAAGRLAGRLAGSTRAPLGRVRTGVAVRRGERHPMWHGRRPAWGAADRTGPVLSRPAACDRRNPLRGCAARLRRPDELLPRFRTYPNGAAAMRALAERAEPWLIGRTQVTEILYAEGVELVAMLPARFELATLYAAAAVAGSPRAALALQQIQLMTSDDTRKLRRKGGFD